MLRKNNFDKIELNNTSCFELFDGGDGEKRVFLWGGKSKYASVLSACNLKFLIETVDEWWEIELFFLAPIKDKKPLSVKLDIWVLHSNIKITIVFVSLVQSDVPVEVNWSIFMKQWVSWSSASLLEESVVLSNKVHIKNLPILDIQAKNIQASHWAKIYRLDWDKLFYLESKWLDYQKAQEVLLSSFPERLFEGIEISDEEKEKLYITYFNYSK